jgi:hypothetical protein
LWRFNRDASRDLTRAPAGSQWFHGPVRLLHVSAAPGRASALSERDGRMAVHLNATPGYFEGRGIDLVAGRPLARRLAGAASRRPRASPARCARMAARVRGHPTNDWPARKSSRSIGVRPVARPAVSRRRAIVRGSASRWPKGSHGAPATVVETTSRSTRARSRHALAGTRAAQHAYCSVRTLTPAARDHRDSVLGSSIAPQARAMRCPMRSAENDPVPMVGPLRSQ